MKLHVNIKEILALLDDAENYTEDCEKCKPFDPCCYLCQIKRINQASKNDELIIEPIQSDK